MITVFLITVWITISILITISIYILITIYNYKILITMITVFFTVSQYFWLNYSSKSLRLYSAYTLPSLVLKGFCLLCSGGLGFFFAKFWQIYHIKIYCMPPHWILVYLKEIHKYKRKKHIQLDITHREYLGSHFPVHRSNSWIL